MKDEGSVDYLMAGLELLGVIRGGPWGLTARPGLDEKSDAQIVDLSGRLMPSPPLASADTQPLDSGSSLQDATNHWSISTDKELQTFSTQI